jgi:uncharacterized protein YbjT (DUF2867 family)
MTEPITVLGATGRTGSTTVDHLLRGGALVRAVTRRPGSDAGQALAAAGAEVVAGDLDDEDSLRRAMEGTTRVFNVQPAYDSRGRHQADVELAQGRAAARAAGAAGIRHVVQLSAGRGQPSGLPHFDTKLEIRRAFEEAGTVVTAVHPGPFMELMVDPSYAPALSIWNVYPRIVGWDRPVPWIALDDIGARCASALMGPVPAGGETVELIGDLRSLGECRALLTDATGRRPRRVPIPTWLFKAMVGDEFVRMWEWLRTVDDISVLPGLTDVPTWAARLTESKDSVAA